MGNVRCFVSLHFNGSNDSGISGTETYYDPLRER